MGGKERAPLHYEDVEVFIKSEDLPFSQGVIEHQVHTKHATLLSYATLVGSAGSTSRRILFTESRS